MNLTAAQREAVAACGNVVVVAGAGTGKTRTLVERCLECVLHGTPRASLDEILIVTFTEAAATELRQRVRARLEVETARNSGDTYWQEQIALFETAHIGTLHSFCFHLVREHFYQLELDPQLAVLPEEEARLLADETLKELFQKVYAGRDTFAEAVQGLIQTHGRGWDDPLRRLVLRLHDYTQTLPDPAVWFGRQLALFEAPEPVVWHEWLLQGVSDWRHRWVQRLGQTASNNKIAAECSKALDRLPASPDRSQAAVALQSISEAKAGCPPRKKTAWLEPLKGFFDEAAFLLSLAQIPEPSQQQTPIADPLIEDWNWVRPHMSTLLQLVQQFTLAFSHAKRESAVVDFHDLEQHTLRLLWDTHTNQPTRIAQAWRNKLRFVFVDEYQDINAAQDKIIEALGRPASQANRFLVGDIKQSIYRFRLANPYIFQSYVEHWGKGAGQAIPLVDNFRSREGILDFINSLFGSLMHRQLGGVEYDQDVRLRFGGAAERQVLSVAASPAPCVELHLRVKGESNNGDAEPSEALAELIELEEAAKEARLMALRLGELKARQHPVWDEPTRNFRPVDWRDMAILLRSPANKSESYAKEFSRLNIPLQVARGGFYRSLEVSDLISLLQILDNPLQDLPLLAVLHSPLVGLSLDELATIRLSASRAHFWTALTRWVAGETPQSTVHSEDEGQRLPVAAKTIGKVSAFLDRFARWRRLARQVSLSRCLEAVLAETHYADWLRTQTQGELRHANVQRLLALAQEFDQFQRQGLFRFLRFIEAQQMAETEPEVVAVAEQNAVRLMSIHQSKGLEFPVVVVADLGKPFNFLDLRADIILDEKYGLCPQIKPPHTARRYPSLPYWLARQRQTRELLGEELRLLYVATTRARDRLLLSGSVAKAKLDRFRAPQGEFVPATAPAPVAPAPPTNSESPPKSAGPEASLLLNARSYMDWLGPWFFQSLGATGEVAEQGHHGLFHWFIRKDAHLLQPDGEGEDHDEISPMPPATDPERFRKLQQRLAWRYPGIAATRHPAKLSVSALRRRANANEDLASGRFQPRGGGGRGAAGSKATTHKSELQTAGPGLRAVPGKTQASAADIGLANHSFLQLVSLDRVGSLSALKQETDRLQARGALTIAETLLLDLDGVAAFWNSELGHRIQSQAQFVRRELAFTARFTPSDLAGFSGQTLEPGLDQEYVIVRGTADLVVNLPQEIWLIDFKTDGLRKSEVSDKVKQYAPQLRLYARALSAIYHRPVSESWLYFLSLRQAVPID